MSQRQKSRIGRRSCISPEMRQALKDLLTEEPDLYNEELADSLLGKFNKKVSVSAVRRAVADWPRKKIRQVAQQRDEDLRDLHLYTLGKLDIESFQCVIVDESGCDLRIRHRRSGRAPKGKTPVKHTKLTRGR